MYMSEIDRAKDFLYSLKGDNGEQIITEIDLETGYINATKLCKSAGRSWYAYYRTAKTKEFLEELSKDHDCAIEDEPNKKSNRNINVLKNSNAQMKQVLIISKVGGNHSGTWVHPDVAIDLASWCSAKFQVAVAKLIRRYIAGELSTNESLCVSILANETNTLVTSFFDKEVVYIGRVNTAEFVGAKIGISRDVKTRDKTHKYEIGDFTLVKVFPTLNYERVERLLLDECTAKGVRRSCIINGKMQTELVEINSKFTWDTLIKIASQIVENNSHPLIEEKEKLIESLILKNTTLELQLEKQNEVESVDKGPEETYDNKHPIDAFIEKYCELGVDTKTDRFRIPSKDLYEEYLKRHPFMFTFSPICEKEFKSYMKVELKFQEIKCNWTYHTRDSWMNIRLKVQPRTLIDQLVTDFIDLSCVLEENNLVDTKVLYDAFHDYAADKGFNIIKQNGFTRQNFKGVLCNIYGHIYVDKWSINGKKHGFRGIMLKNQKSAENIIKDFVDDQCLKIIGIRITNVELWKAFSDYVKKVEHPLHICKSVFYDTLHEQNPQLTRKHVTKSDMGFVGISLK
jgi:hypothetical protein